MRGSGTLIVADAVEQRGRCASRADGVELDLGRLDRLVHAPLGVLHEIVDRWWH
jgi:hypothetical protein